MSKHTPGPLYVGCQNDALFIVAGRLPAADNDAPFHESPRVCLAKVFGPTEGDCLAVDEAANARRLVAAWNACEGISTEALEQGVVAELVAALVMIYSEGRGG